MLGRTVRVQSAENIRSGLKFGNYMQALDPVTGVHMELDMPLGPAGRANFPDYHRSRSMNCGVVVFRDIHYSRAID